VKIAIIKTILNEKMQEGDQNYFIQTKYKLIYFSIISFWLNYKKHIMRKSVYLEFT